jgi:hypothetical protein
MKELRVGRRLDARTKVVPANCEQRLSHPATYLADFAKLGRKKERISSLFRFGII